MSGSFPKSRASAALLSDRWLLSIWFSAFQRLDEICRDLVDGLAAVDFGVDALLLVVLDEGLRRSLVHGEAVLHRLFRIIGTLEELAAARVADALFLRRFQLLLLAQKR